MTCAISARLVLTAMLVSCLTACTVTRVEPWQRGILAKPEMAWDTDSLTASYRAHVYFSKEASTGGASVSGGGCGCN